MKLKFVVDASIIFSLLLGSEKTRKILDSNFIKLYSPEYLFEELEEHKREIKELSKLSSEKYDKLFKKLKSKIKTISKEKFDFFLMQANPLISDKDDTEYLALSLSFNKMPIWSEDSHFQEQGLVKVFKTDELIRYLKSLEYEL